MQQEKIKGDVSGDPLNNNWPSDNKNLTDKNHPMTTLPEKIGNQIPYFREKPVILLPEGYSIFFKIQNNLEYWISEKRRKGSYLLQWIEMNGSKTVKFHRKLSNRNGLDVENKKRDQNLANYLYNRSGIEKEETKIFLEEAGIFIEENRDLITPINEEIEDKLTIFSIEQDEKEEISEEKRNELIFLLKREDLLSFIDKALYERSPDEGFIIGEVESKHVLNFNCVGARLGLSTINTLK